jgi:MFS family permease
VLDRAKRLAEDAVRGNFVLNVLDGAFYSLGMSVVSRTSVLPVLVRKLGGDNIAVGLLPVLWFIGFNLPQLFIANRARYGTHKKGLMLSTALLQRFPWVLLALVTYLSQRVVSADLALTLFFVVFALAAVGGSLHFPVWFDVVAKVTPVRLRGRLFAWRTIVGGGLGVLGGWAAERVLNALAFPESFALLFGAAFAVTMLSYIFLSQVQEHEASPPGEALHFLAFVRRLPEILRVDRNYRNFIVGEALVLSATMAEAFYTVDAFDKFALSEGYAGRFTVVTTVSVIPGTLLFGYLADRFGHRLNLVLSALCTALACAVAIVAPTVEVYYLAFTGAALTLSLRQISRWPIVAEICGERDRPTYVALSNVITAPFVLTGLAAGWLANRHGYDVVFWAAGGLALLAALWIGTMVREPRRERAGG